VWKKKDSSLKHYGKPETIFHLTFSAAESDEKQIKVKVDAFPHFPLSSRVRLCSNWYKNLLVVKVQRDLLRPSKLIKKSIKLSFPIILLFPL
jgi:hypothetical protein